MSNSKTGFICQSGYSVRQGVALYFFILHSEHLIDVEGEVELITKHITKDTTSKKKLTNRMRN